MIWLNSTREKIKSDNPGISVTDVARKAGELWKEMTDKSEWEEKAAKEKEKYIEAMKVYNESGGAASDKEKVNANDGGGKKRKIESPSKKAAPAAMKGSSFKSKEYIETDSSSSGEDGDKEKVKKKVC